MSVPTNPKLRHTVGLVDKIGNFGSFPPTEAYRDRWGGQGILLNLHDPDCNAVQIIGIRSHGVWGGVWEPVPPAADDGAGRAKFVHERIAAIDAGLVAKGQPKVDVVGLNLEGYTITQVREFLWGRMAGDGVTKVKGWRGSGGGLVSADCYRPGIATYWIDEPFKDGGVKPHVDLQLARVMLAVEGFLGPHTDPRKIPPARPDMDPADHARAIVDRIEGRRWDGTIVLEEAYPSDQVVGCYDGALARIGVPLARGGLHFTIDRMREYSLL